MKPPKKKELAQLLAFIADSYAGDYASVSRDLNKAICFLHFLQKDEIPRNEIQDLCFALHKLGECFYQVHSKQRTKKHQQLVKLLEVLTHPEDYE
ncbi:MAG: hypothetical protein AAGF85_15275 [Bacteroidota bacterium]